MRSAVSPVIAGEDAVGVLSNTTRRTAIPVPVRRNICCRRTSRSSDASSCSLAKVEASKPSGIMATILACLGIIATSSQQVRAQDFTLFEHAIVPPKTDQQPARQYLPAIYQTGPADVSYREGLYMAAIAEAERRYGLPTNLLRALIWAESRFNPMAVSPAGAAGLAQLMPATARELGVRNRHDPLASIDGGARYLRDMLDRFDAVHLALAAYNAGPGAVSRSRGIPSNGETPQYVRSCLLYTSPSPRDRTRSRMPSSA